MTTPHSEQQRVDELLARFKTPDACAAELLCDRHPPERVAYRILHEGASLESFATAPERITYGELRDESERFAAALRGLGVGQGDRVAMLMGKSRQFLEALMGIWRLGAVHVPLFTAFARPQLRCGCWAVRPGLSFAMPLSSTSWRPATTSRPARRGN